MPVVVDLKKMILLNVGKTWSRASASIRSRAVCCESARAVSAAQALAQPPQLRPDLLAAEFPLECCNSVDAGLGAQARQASGVARTDILGGNRLGLGLQLRRRRGLGPGPYR